jgi:hypothetical protein
MNGQPSTDRLDVHVYLHLSNDDPGRVTGLLDQILTRMGAIQRQESTMSAELDALTAQAKVNSDVEASALIVINGIAARITAAGTDPAALAALTTELQASAQPLAAAVAANTPAA